MEGFSRPAFRQRFGADALALYPGTIAESRAAGVEVTPGHIHLTRRRWLLGNQAFTFLLEA